MAPIDNLYAYMHQANVYFVVVSLALASLFFAVNLLARTDPRLNELIAPTFQVKFASDSNSAHWLFGCNRGTFVQVIDVLMYSMIIAFILVDGLLLDISNGTSCQFAQTVYVDSGYECFLVRRGLVGSLQAFSFNCTAALTNGANGFMCFRGINYEEIDFYLFANTVGISAALLPPLVFAIQFLSFLLLWTIDRVSCVNAKEPKPYRRRLISWGIIFIVGTCGLLAVLLFLFYASIVSRETFIVALTFFIQGCLYALLRILDEKNSGDMLEVPGPEEL